MLTTKYLIEKRRWSGNVLYRADLIDGKKTIRKMICSFSKEYDHLLDLVAVKLNLELLETIKNEKS